jgi:hypothetical protein
VDTSRLHWLDAFDLVALPSNSVGTSRDGWCGRRVRPLNFIVRRFRTILDPSSLLWGLLFGSIGLGFFVYGRRQKRVVPLVSGLALMIFPYFVSNTIVLVTLGIALIAIPYFVRM